MIGLTEEPLKLAAVIPRSYGRTRAVLVQDITGRCFIVKIGPDPTCPNALANEAIGADLMLHLGIPTPRWRVISLSKRELVAIGKCQSLSIDPEPGLHFASECLDHPDYTLCDEREDRDHGGWCSCNHDKFTDIFIFDIWVNRGHLRQWMTRKYHDRKSERQIYFIDNANIFDGGVWGSGPPNTIGNNPIKPLCSTIGPDLRSRILHFQRIGRRAVLQTLREVPREWHQEDFRVLEECLMDRLADLFPLVEAQVVRLSRLPSPKFQHSRDNKQYWEHILDDLRIVGDSVPLTLQTVRRRA